MPSKFKSPVLMRASSPSPKTTLVVILGASEWPRCSALAPSQAFLASARDVEGYFKGRLFSLPSENLYNLFNEPGSPAEIYLKLSDFLIHAQSRGGQSGRPIRDLILYYVGHGGFTSDDQAYFLAIPSTETDFEGISSLRMADLARILNIRAQFIRRYLILDCCFAESALAVLQASASDFAGAAHRKALMDFPGKGTALLCSSSARDFAVIPQGEAYTMFSGALLDVLRNGDSHVEGALSLADVGRAVTDVINAKFPQVVRPTVSSPDSREGDIAQIPLFPNPAHIKGSRLALLIADAECESSQPGNFVRAAPEVTELAEVLKRPDRGCFDEVQVLIGQPKQMLEEALEDLLTRCEEKDTLLVYFSGEGFLDGRKELRLAASNTRPDRLASTAIGTRWLIELFLACKARRQMILLDSSFAEAFAGSSSETGGLSSLAVLTSTHESGRPIGKGVAGGERKIFFTRKLVEGLVSGDADADGDGKIGLGEILQYVTKTLKAANIPQKLTLLRFGSEEYEMSIGYTPQPKAEMLKHNQFVASGERLALLIASADYQDSELRKLLAPPHDARALEALLAAPNIGRYQTRVLINEPKSVVERAIDRMLADCGQDDKALIFFAGHGIKHPNGKLYFAVSDTDSNYLGGTAVASNWLVEQMQNSRARRQIVLLDCCFGGAFARGQVGRGAQVESGLSLQVPESELEADGRGQVVITAADAMQFALEGGELKGQPPASHFMRVLVEGLKTGAADLDGDGKVTVDELMKYLIVGLKKAGSPQRPTRWIFGQTEGDLLFALNPHVAV